MTHYVLPANEVREVLARAKQAAVDYYRLTGKPLGVTGEVGEYEAARLLGLSLVAARVPGHDAPTMPASGIRSSPARSPIPNVQTVSASGPSSQLRSGTSCCWS